MPPDTTCRGSPRTGRPNESIRPACRARLSPPRVTRTMYRLPRRSPPGASTSSSDAWPNTSEIDARSRRATAAVSSSASITMCPEVSVSPPANRSSVDTSVFRQHGFTAGTRLSSSFTTPVIAIATPPP